MTGAARTALASVAEFIWLEADLLDHRDYQAWLALWDNQGKYIVPTDCSSDDFENTLNYAYDGADMRDMRVRRLTSGQSMSAANAARTVRTVSRFRRLPDRADGCVRLRCAQNIVEYKFEQHRIYAANVSWTLRPAGESFHIVEKIVRLINAGDALAGMTFLP